MGEILYAVTKEPLVDLVRWAQTQGLSGTIERLSTPMVVDGTRTVFQYRATIDGFRRDASLYEAFDALVETNFRLAKVGGETVLLSIKEDDGVGNGKVCKSAA